MQALWKNFMVFKPNSIYEVPEFVSFVIFAPNR